MNARRISLVAVACGLLCASVCGCMGYRFGTPRPQGVQTIHVVPVVNRCDQPDIEDDVTSAVIAAVQKEESISVSEANRADAILRVTLQRLRLVPLRYAKDRAMEAVEFRMLLSARVVLVERQTGRVLTDNTCEGRTTFEPAGDLSGGRSAAIPALARDLAHRVVETALETW